MATPITLASPCVSGEFKSALDTQFEAIDSILVCFLRQPQLFAAAEST